MPVGARRVLVSGRNAAGGFSLTAPVLAWLTGAGDSTPAFSADIDPAALSSDSHHVQVSTTSNFASIAQEVTTTVADIEASLGLAALTTGTWYIRSRLERPAATAASNWSNTLTLTIDVTAPTITSATTANNAENSVLAHALTANETVTWTITGGADQARFELSGSTLRWASNGTKDYETPNDADTNNTYVVQVTATDTAGNATNQTVTITVTDVAEGVAFELAYVDHQEVTADGASASYTSMGIGTADTNRIVAVVIVWRTNGAAGISAVTIGGVSATHVAGADGSSPNALSLSEIWYAAVPTGTTATVAVTFNSSSGRSSCATYRIITVTPAPTNANASGAASGDVSAALTVPSGGKGIAGYFSRTDTDGAHGLTNATEDVEVANIEGFSSASFATVAASAVISRDASPESELAAVDKTGRVAPPVTLH